jgi:hypothetical protein
MLLDSWDLRKATLSLPTEYLGPKVSIEVSIHVYLTIYIFIYITNLNSENSFLSSFPLLLVCLTPLVFRPLVYQRFVSLLPLFPSFDPSSLFHFSLLV